MLTGKLHGMCTNIRQAATLTEQRITFCGPDPIGLYSFAACKGREPYQIMEDYVKVPHRDDLIALDAAYRKYRPNEYLEE